MGGGAGGAGGGGTQNLPFLPQILAFLCLQPPHVPVSPRTFKFTPPSVENVVFFSERSIVLKLPVKRAQCGLVFTTHKQLVYEYKQYCDVVLLDVFTKDKGSRFNENMKKCNEDDVNYCVMCRLRHCLVKFGSYAMR